MAERGQDHGRVAVRPAIASAAFNQLLDLAFSQVLAGAHVDVLWTAWCDFPYFGGWRQDSQGWFFPLVSVLSL